MALKRDRWVDLQGYFAGEDDAVFDAVCAWEPMTDEGPLESGFWTVYDGLSPIDGRRRSKKSDP